jgi:2-polyprenyl-6-methoxyphenol hydroxylase-like FAD-dependent oxidoreductase
MANNKNILISGAGIAGVTLAFWLKKFGFNPTIVEISPKLREGGYAIDFWGAGYEVSSRMGIVPELEKVDMGITEVAFVDENNKRKGGLDYLKIKEMMNGRAFTFLRSDLSKVIYKQLGKDTEVIFGDSIEKLEQQTNDVKVTFRSGETRNFDLVIGADGLHSVVRKLTFGDEAQFENYYGYYTASYTIKDNIYNDSAFLMYNVPGKQVALYAVKDGKSAAFYIFNSPEKINYSHHDTEKQKQILRDEFGNAGWKCPQLLSKMDDAEDFYFDCVSQIKMEHWSKGRISLVGDACDCPSLLSGQGSTLAMVGAYILAGELKDANGNY